MMIFCNEERMNAGWFKQKARFCCCLLRYAWLDLKQNGFAIIKFWEAIKYKLLIKVFVTANVQNIFGARPGW